MDATTLATFRQGVYASFSRARDALFEVADALLTAPQPRSFVELSQAPGMQRRWPSCSAALADGRVGRDALRRLFARHLPPPDPPPGGRHAGGPHPRLRAEHAGRGDAGPAGLGLLHAGRPAGPGEQLDPHLGQPARAQQRDGDGHYGTAAWVRATAALPCDQLLRAKRTAALYRPAPPRTGKRGHPPLDGPRFRGSAPATHGPPDAEWQGADARGQAVTVTCWGGLRLHACRAAPFTAVRIARAGAAGTKRDPREAWFWWLGAAPPPPGALPPLDARRFGIEHGYTLDKQALLWDAPRVRTPAQFERWTDLVAVAHNQLVLARPLAERVRRPWDARSRAASPQQARRAMGRIIAQVGTPARPPRPRRKAPGRPPGAVVRPATRHPVLRKAPPQAASRCSAAPRARHGSSAALRYHAPRTARRTAVPAI